MDDCTPIAATLADRRLAATARYAATGGPVTDDYVIAIGLDLGHTIEVDEPAAYQPFMAGISMAGDPLLPLAWRYHFVVIAPRSLSCRDRDRLECEIDRVKPAYTLAIYIYGDALQDEAGNFLRDENGVDYILAEDAGEPLCDEAGDILTDEAGTTLYQEAA